MTQNVKTIVLTGGPCSGKTTAMSHLVEYLSGAGIHALVVPETATTLINAGIRPWEVGTEAFQESVLFYQSATEALFKQAAADIAKTKPVVILHDRGILDGAAYCEPAFWEELTTETGLSHAMERDKRYDAVIHMVTAANGAEKFYTLENNPARKEGAELARQLDDRIIRAWTGHPKLRVIDNSTSFQRKLQRVTQEVMSCIGIPLPIEKERKFKIQSGSAGQLQKMGLPHNKVRITQTYLLSPDGEERRVRERMHDTPNSSKSATYSYTVKKPLRAGERIEEEKLIDKETYLALLEQKDPKLSPIVKDRHYVLHKGTYLEVDVYHNPKLDFEILEVEGSNPPEIPSFVKAIDVTSDTNYSNRKLAESAAIDQINDTDIDI